MGSPSQGRARKALRENARSCSVVVLGSLLQRPQNHLYETRTGETAPFKRRAARREVRPLTGRQNGSRWQNRLSHHRQSPGARLLRPAAAGSTLRSIARAERRLVPARLPRVHDRSHLPPHHANRSNQRTVRHRYSRMRDCDDRSADSSVSDVASSSCSGRSRGASVAASSSASRASMSSPNPSSR